MAAVDAATVAATQAAGLDEVYVQQLVIPLKKAASLGGLVAQVHLFVFCVVSLGLKRGEPGAGIIARSAKIK